MCPNVPKIDPVLRLCSCLSIPRTGFTLQLQVSIYTEHGEEFSLDVVLSSQSFKIKKALDLGDICYGKISVPFEESPPPQFSSDLLPRLFSGRLQPLQGCTCMWSAWTILGNHNFPYSHLFSPSCSKQTCLFLVTYHQPPHSSSAPTNMPLIYTYIFT